MVNHKNVQKWVDALRGGEFKQGYNALRHQDDTYCCLGVACEVYRRETGNGFWVRPADLEGPYGFGTAVDSGWLPYAVQKWLGIYGLDPRISLGDNESPRTLTMYNDTFKCDFEEIAEIVEEEWLSKVPA